MPVGWQERAALWHAGFTQKAVYSCHIFQPVCLGDKPRLPCRGATLPLLQDRPGEMRSHGPCTLQPGKGHAGVSEPGV